MKRSDGGTPPQQIKAGDLVMVVRGSDCGCFGNKRIGRIFRVIEVNNKLTTCSGCGKLIEGPFATNGETILSFYGTLQPQAYDLRRLKRIPPLDELDKAKDQESHPIVTGDLDTQRAIHDR